MSTTAEEPESGGYQQFDCTGPEPEAYADAIEAARKAIEDGACIVLPTDTVYGIGADAFSPAAVQALLDAKHRGRDMPPPVLIAEPSLIRALATEVPQEAKDLVAEHWPGPLTVICQIQPSLRMDLGDSKDTIALRVPDHPLTREILRRTGPMAVSSANLSGQPAALTCDEAINQLGDAVAVYLDGGPLTAYEGAASTIVDFTQYDDGEVLRLGALSLEVLRKTLPDLHAGVAEVVEEAEDEEQTLRPLQMPLLRKPALRPAQGAARTRTESDHQTARRRRAWFDGPRSAGACALLAFRSRSDWSRSDCSADAGVPAGDEHRLCRHLL